MPRHQRVLMAFVAATGVGAIVTFDDVIKQNNVSGGLHRARSRDT